MKMKKKLGFLWSFGESGGRNLREMGAGGVVDVIREMKKGMEGRKTLLALILHELFKQVERKRHEILIKLIN